MKQDTITGRVIRVHQDNVNETYGEIEAGSNVVRSPLLLPYVGQNVTITIEAT